MYGEPESFSLFSLKLTKNSGWQTLLAGRRLEVREKRRHTSRQRQEKKKKTDAAAAPCRKTKVSEGKQSAASE